MEMSDQERFTQLWTQAQPTVAAYIHSMVPSFHDAEEVVQRVAIVLLRKFSEYKPELSFTKWAIGVARFEVLSMKRSHARSFLTYRTDLVDVISDVYQEMEPELTVRSHALQECLQSVQGQAREVLKMRYEEALTPKIISEKIGMTAGAVRVMLLRIRSTLRQCVQAKVQRNAI
jgi:RNA polymerase sigma-70 factor, ECF subfamily